MPPSLSGNSRSPSTATAPGRPNRGTATACRHACGTRSGSGRWRLSARGFWGLRDGPLSKSYSCSSCRAVDWSMTKFRQRKRRPEAACRRTARHGSGSSTHSSRWLAVAAGKYGAAASGPLDIAEEIDFPLLTDAAVNFLQRVGLVRCQTIVAVLSGGALFDVARRIEVATARIVDHPVRGAVRARRISYRARPPRS